MKADFQPTIEQLFDSPIKMRLLKFFLRNPEQEFCVADAARKTGCGSAETKRHIFKLKDIGALVRRSGKKGKPNFSLNAQFLLYPELKNLILKSIPVPLEKLKQQVKGLGGIKFAVASGVFINEEGCRIDLMLVGERINQKKLNNFVRKTEQHIGKEINYVVFSQKEFGYRMDVRDRFVRDILEEKHEVLIQKIKL